MTPGGHERGPGDRLTAIRAAAEAVLDANWLGSSTVPTQSLYPHQWSWDSAFIAIGRSWSDEGRARTELETLFRAQWANGKVPQIVFNPAVPEDAYFPGPGFWQSSARSADAPRAVQTSGITQPPIHARAALEMHRHARDPEASRAFLGWLYPRLVAEHDYLASARDPTRIGLAAVVHPWESGFDNSPVWDRDLGEIEIPAGAVPAYRRHDLDHADPADRPTAATYDRFVYLAARYRDAGYDDSRIVDAGPFVIAGPFFNAIYLWSSHALVEIAEILGADPGPHRAAVERIHGALLEHCWDPAANRFAAMDVITMERGSEDTIVAFGPLLDPDLPAGQRAAIMADLRSAAFHPDRPTGFVVPTYNRLRDDFDRRRYWRGPIWINTNWLLWSGLTQHRQDSESNDIVASSLRLVEQSGFREYFDPVDGSGHGADGFAWTAALTIDLIERGGADGPWLAPGVQASDGTD